MAYSGRTYAKHLAKETANEQNTVDESNLGEIQV